ncbi:ERCC1 nucleotide excision repair protein, putative [Babesia caballi]|uniref:ERCC1 nucleotide excision repair protein, putative n=1 Tax=Babesia caballi TaxID=5871 RepID=A0AAV4LVG9_BABCB|nr:ERCC1 nucleotide excision repair protein, putative [Babesia caballi]
MDANTANLGDKHCILASVRQRGNPLIRHLTRVTCVEGDTQYDYKVSEEIQVLFLSLKYHRMHRGYIAARMKQLREHRVRNPFIICQVDIAEPQNAIGKRPSSRNVDSHTAELTLATFSLGYRLLLSWSARESAAVLEILKLDGQKGLEFLQRKQEKPHIQTVREIIACVRSVNSTDAVAIANRCDTVKQLMHISADKLEGIHGLGQRKVKALISAFNDNFF